MQNMFTLHRLRLVSLLPIGREFESDSIAESVSRNVDEPYFTLPDQNSDPQIRVQISVPKMGPVTIDQNPSPCLAMGTCSIQYSVVIWFKSVSGNVNKPWCQGTTSPSPCLSKFNIISMVTVAVDRMDTRSVLPVEVPVTIDTMLNFDGYADVDVTLRVNRPWRYRGQVTSQWECPYNRTPGWISLLSF